MNIFISGLAKLFHVHLGQHGEAKPASIFIIGPEAAGKTVFATMLNEYVGRNPQTGLVFRAVDIETKKYLAREYDVLKKGEWPTQTKGKLVALNWIWDANGRTSNVSLIDPPGHEIRLELCGGSNSLQILDKIKGADLLILLVDLYGHQKDNKEKQIENAWIVEHVLNHVKGWQSLLLAVTKADMLTGSLPQSQWANRTEVLQLVKTMMPDLNLTGYMSKLFSDNCRVLAFSSVTTTGNQAQDGKLVRLPKSPLASAGINQVVTSVLDAFKRKSQAEEEGWRNRIRRMPRKVIGIVCCVLGLIVAYLAYLLYWYVITRS